MGFPPISPDIWSSHDDSRYWRCWNRTLDPLIRGWNPHSEGLFYPYWLKRGYSDPLIWTLSARVQICLSRDGSISGPQILYYSMYEPF